MATTVGIRELKNRLSHYVRKVEAGETVLVTVSGRTVAQLSPLLHAGRQGAGNGFDALVAAGLIRAPIEHAPLTSGWKTLHLPPGTAAALVDEDREERY